MKHDVEVEGITVLIVNRQHAITLMSLVTLILTFGQ